jgi:hypothetical protein
MSKWALIYWGETTHRWIWRTYMDHIALKEGPLDASQDRKFPEPKLCTAFRHR